MVDGRGRPPTSRPNFEMYSFDLEPVPTVYRGTGMRKETVSELVKSVPLSLGSVFVLLYEITNENFAM